MGIWPSVTVVRVEVTNHRQRRRLNGQGRERDGKGSAWPGQVRAGKASESEPLSKCRKN